MWQVLVGREALGYSQNAASRHPWERQSTRSAGLGIIAYLASDWHDEHSVHILPISRPVLCKLPPEIPRQIYNYMDPLTLRSARRTCKECVPG